MKVVSRETFSHLCKEGYEKYYDYYIENMLERKILMLIRGNISQDTQGEYKLFNEWFKDGVAEKEIEILEFSYPVKLYYPEDSTPIFPVIAHIYNDEVLFIDLRYLVEYCQQQYQYICEHNQKKIKYMFKKGGLSDWYDKYFPIIEKEIKIKDIEHKYNSKIESVKGIIDGLDSDGFEQEFVNVIIKQCQDRIIYLEQLKDKEIEVLEWK